MVKFTVEMQIGNQYWLHIACFIYCCIIFAYYKLTDHRTTIAVILQWNF